MRLDRRVSLGDGGCVNLVSPERESGVFTIVDGATSASEEPPAIKLDENAKLLASVGETIDKLASLSENFFLVLQRYTVEQQRVINVWLEQQQNLQAEKVMSNRKLAEYTYSFGLFNFTTAKGKVVAGDVEKLNQSITAIKNVLLILHKPVRSQVEILDTLNASINDQQFKLVADELKVVCDQIAVLVQVCFHLYAQLSTSAIATGKKRKVSMNSDIWTELQSARVQVVNFEQFLRVVYLISTQNRHIPASRHNVKSRLLRQLNSQNSADLSNHLDDDDHHVADNLLWTLFQAWSEPTKHKSAR